MHFLHLQGRLAFSSIFFTRVNCKGLRSRYNLVMINDDKSSSRRHLAFTLCQVLLYTFYVLLIKKKNKQQQNKNKKWDYDSGNHDEREAQIRPGNCWACHALLGVGLEEGIGNHSTPASAGSPGRRLPTLPVNQPCPGWQSL